MTKTFKTILPEGSVPETPAPTVMPGTGAPEPVPGYRELPGGPHSPSEFELAIGRFLVTCKDISDAYFAKNFKNLTPPVFSLTYGPSYVKVWRKDGPGASRGSIHCFVRRTDGAILKAEGINKPAKHSRGSIYINEGADAVGPHGANYLR